MPRGWLWRKAAVSQTEHPQSPLRWMRTELMHFAAPQSWRESARTRSTFCHHPTSNNWKSPVFQVYCVRKGHADSNLENILATKVLGNRVTCRQREYAGANHRANKK